jgi:hypothetical protein
MLAIPNKYILAFVLKNINMLFDGVVLVLNLNGFCCCHFVCPVWFGVV